MCVYNQSGNDPVVLNLAKTNGCTLDREYNFVGVKVRVYKGENMRGEKCTKAVVMIELTANSTLSFSLSDLNVKKTLPLNGHLNLIGYSWGGVVAARSALFHAKQGVKIGTLALIGAPINYSLLDAVKKNKNIQNLIIKNLVKEGDPIYAGMTDSEIISAAATLGNQMLSGSGHFYYSAADEIGMSRRRELVKELIRQNLR